MSLKLFDLTGKTALVTGGTHGLGMAIANGLANAGAKIVINDVSREKLDNAVKEYKNKGIDIHAYLFDVTDDKAVDEYITRIEKEVAPVDILVNNAGIIRREDALNFSEKDWDDVMNINIKTLFFFSQAVAKQYVEQNTGGKIINIASMLSFQGGIRVPSYTASKSAVMGVTRLMANEWAKHNINVNAIAPGYMATDNTAPLRADPVRSAEILGRIPAGRWGKPEDLQGIAVFLASEASNYVNGYTIAVDGGWLAR